MQCIIITGNIPYPQSQHNSIGSCRNFKERMQCKITDLFNIKDGKALKDKPEHTKCMYIGCQLQKANLNKVANNCNAII